MKLISGLFNLARRLNDAEKLVQGKIVGRLVNKQIGKSVSPKIFQKGGKK